MTFTLPRGRAMKTRSVLMLVMIAVALVAAGCGRQSLPFDVSLHPTLPPAADSIDGLVMDAVGLAHVLNSGGASVRLGAAVQQPFLSVSGQLLEIGMADVQVFEYSSERAA